VAISLTVPSSKSHTIRALLFACMAKGKSRIMNPLLSPDTSAMIDAIRQFGAKVEVEEKALIIEGIAGKLKPAEDVIQCGNSGQVLRFMGAMAALSEGYTILTGDSSIRHQRPVKPLLDGLTQLGALALSSRQDGYAPIIVKGPLKSTIATIEGQDSQPVSALLMLGAFHGIDLHVQNPGEKPWVNLTLSWLSRFNIRYENRNFEHFKVEGGAQIEGFEYRVPADFSSAAFPLVAALITGSEVTIENLDLEDVQGDKAIINVLISMGANIEVRDSKVTVKKSPPLRGLHIDVNDFIDALPILAVAACYALGETRITGALIARRKESDRIHCMAKELKKMGAQIEELEDGLIVRPSLLRGSETLQSHFDHRIAMALSVAAMGASGKSTIQNIDCVSKSYPTFFEDFKKLGLNFNYQDESVQILPAKT
jgi:3-phosphoshikimate 1-carboxyvinyltransferase